MKQPSRPPFRNAKLIESFRGEVRAPLPLHPLELALVVVASIHLCFLPWALGARGPITQIISASLGIASLVLAAWPRRYAGELAPQGAFILHTWSRLVRFPIFWLGLLLFSYVICQGLNPAYLRADVIHYWWLAPVEHITWLPSGVDAPFERMNAWRMLIIWGGAWALSCALWAGITRRVSLHNILAAVVANGALLALVGILQKVTYAHKILWLIQPPADYFVSTFVYKNHAGAYFNIILSISIALAAWHQARALRRLERSSPTPVYTFAAILLSCIVFMSSSRAAMIILSGYVFTASVVVFISRIKTRGTNTHPAIVGLGAIGVILLMSAAAWFLNLDDGVDQVHSVTIGQEQAIHLQPRTLARQATLDLFKEHPLIGWGAGSFRHIFPITQKNYESIFRADATKILVWDHAHNDYIQILSELGALGASILAAMAIWSLVRAAKISAFSQPTFLLLFLGLLLPLAHALIDFPLYNCAIVTTFTAVIILSLRWAELENSR